VRNLKKEDEEDKQHNKREKKVEEKALEKIAKQGRANRDSDMNYFVAYHN
jgi:hypothetical protein